MDYDPERLLRRLEWTVIRRLDGVLQGDYRTLFRGFGIDLADLREYQAHDDVRYIDWNVTARLQTPYVREFNEDREVAAWFLTDLSGSVDFGSQTVRKRALATTFVAVMARLLCGHGNRAGVVLYGGSGDDVMNTVIPARNGRRHLLHVMDRMHRFAASAGRETDLDGLLARARQILRRRSVVFVVSDFISRPGWERALSLLARRHEVVAVRLYDPLEVELPDLGLVVLQDAETGEQLFVDTNDGKFRRRFADAAAAREQWLRETLATGEPLDDALLRFTRLRKRRSQLASGGVYGAAAR